MNTAWHQAAADPWTKPISKSPTNSVYMYLVNHTHNCHLLLLGPKADTDNFTVPLGQKAESTSEAGNMPKCFTCQQMVTYHNLAQPAKSDFVDRDECFAVKPNCYKMLVVSVLLCML